MLPDGPLLIEQKLIESAKIKNSNATFWVIFKHCGWINVLWKMSRCVFQYRMMRLFCTFYVHSVMEVRFIRLSLCTKSKRLRVLLKDVCLLWVLLKRRIELYPLRCPFSAFRIFWTAHWDRKCRFSTFQCLDWTFSFFDVLTFELRLQWLQQPTFNRHEPLILDWKYKGGIEKNKSCEHQKGDRNIAKL